MKIDGKIESSCSVSGSIKADLSASGSINTAADASGNITPENIITGKFGFGGSVKELFFSKLNEFPSIGNESSLYVDTDENAVYRFSSDSMTYKCVSRDYEDIEIIQCEL